MTATGFSFVPNRENLRRWKGWMRYITVDQGIIFWLLGFITLFLLSVNACAVLAPRGLVPEGMQIAIWQAYIFGDQWGTFGFKLFLVMAFLMLFSVMWTVIDALTRMVSDIVYTHSRFGSLTKVFVPFRRLPLSHLYYGTIVLVVVIEAVLVSFEQPLTWLVISGVLSGLTMAIYTPLLLYFNNTKLPKELRPHRVANLALVLISLFFIGFAIKVILGLFD